MNTRKITVIVMASAAVIWIIWDIVAAISPEKGDTISEIVKYAAQDWKGVPFSFSALAAHFFWPINVQRPPALYWALFSLLISIALATFIWHAQFAWLMRDSNMVAMGVGLIAGRLLWPQKKPTPKANK